MSDNYYDMLSIGTRTSQRNHIGAGTAYHVLKGLNLVVPSVTTAKTRRNDGEPAWQHLPSITQVIHFGTVVPARTIVSMDEPVTRAIM